MINLEERNYLDTILTSYIIKKLQSNLISSAELFWGLGTTPKQKIQMKYHDGYTHKIKIKSKYS